MSEEFLTHCRSGFISANDKEWICKTCANYFKQQRVPPQSVSNKLAVHEVPDELKDLTNLEARLLAKRYTFMKIVSLPQGRQSGIRGGVVNVPVAAESV